MSERSPGVLSLLAALARTAPTTGASGASATSGLGAVLWTIPHSKLKNGYTAAAQGDLIQYDFGKGKGWQHLAMVTSWGSYVNYYDSGVGKNYNSINGGKGD